VIVAFGQSHPEDWSRLAQHIEEESAASGLELALPQLASRPEAETWVAAVRRVSTLPLLVKLPAAQAEFLAEACVGAGADALVIGSGPLVVGKAAGPEAIWIEGVAGGPAALPFALRALRAVSALEPKAPLVAAGGIARLDDARMCLGEGAVAVQVRSLCWVDPARVAALAEALGPLPPTE
jgi:dihydroorotate dehydrogenase